jgi:eukaryotic-like serine/threonine-protein kinase
MLCSAAVLSDRYELVRRIGAGGFSEVWQARDLVLGRAVAVKLLYAGFAQHAETLARFRAEARHCGRLSHENIARIYDYDEPAAPDLPFLVLELVDGPSLAAVLAGGALAPARGLSIIAQAAAGLAAAHRAGLVHRDIKPGNLLIAPGDVVKITDFGIARALDSAPVTSTGMLIGTPAYLAPERVAGRRATPAGDLYSLGIVAYECLAGVAPFAGNAFEVSLAHRDLRLPPLPASVPPEAAALVRDLTAKDPGARPASAGEVARRAGELARGLGAGPRHEPVPALSAGPGGELIPGLGASPGGEMIPGLGASPGEELGDLTAAGPDAIRPQRTAPLLVLPAQPGPGASAPPGRPARSGRPGGGRPARRWVLAAAIALAAVAGLVAASEIGQLPARPPVPAPSSTARPVPSAVAMVEVSDSSLAGQPVSTVVRKLRQQGLLVHVRWVASSALPPGTAVSIRPAGRRPVGSLVTVIGTRRPAAKGHGNGDGHGGDHGHGNGDGGGHGNGNENG